MSEAEKIVDVEDVLSSIRRLVADGPRTVSKAVDRADNVQKPADPEPEPAFETQPPASEPEANRKSAKFVDTMNASIAKITDDADQDVNLSLETDAPVEKTAPDDDELLEDAQTRAAHIDAFLENKTDVSTEMAGIIGNTIAKPRPFVLRADMATKADPPETAINMAADSDEATGPDALEEPELVLREENKDQEEYEAASKDIPEDEMAFPEPDETADQDTAAQPSDEQFIDEDMLRKIVGELVRSELQGDLGDRITRNVRKLVRREIHHALATRDFD